MNLPNQLTTARFVMALLFVIVMSFPNVYCQIAGLVLFILGALTDFYDGKIARARNLVTNFGKLMDPLADKVLVAAAFIMLMEQPRLAIPGWTIVAILAREFLVTGLRTLAASEGAVLAANRWGKIKTALQMGYIVLCLLATAALNLLEALHALSQETLAQAGSALAAASCYAIVAVACFTAYSGAAFVRMNVGALKLGDL